MRRGRWEASWREAEWVFVLERAEGGEGAVEEGGPHGLWWWWW